MSESLERLGGLLERMSSRLSMQPTFGWAVVTSIAPLRIRYELESADIAGTPDRLVSGLVVGDRVWVQRLHRRDVILGVARGHAPARSGVVSQHTGALTKIGTSTVYGAAMRVTVPVAVSPDERVKLTPLNIGSGWGSFAQVSQVPELGSTAVTGRFTQVENTAAQTLTFLWEIIKLTD